MNPFTVIIPSCTLGNVQACLESIKQNQPGTDVCVIANGDLLNHIVAEPRCTVVEWTAPFNFAEVINYGAALAVALSGSKYRIADNQPADSTSLLIDTKNPGNDILILNDDTRLLTRNGFNLLRDAAYSWCNCGLMFPSVTGCTGNPEQINRPGGKVRAANRHVVPFIGVYIRRDIWNEIGPMDPRYCIDYGVEDNDYCYRATQAGYEIGIYDGCVLEHGVLPSAYRSQGPRSFAANAKLFEEKHGVSVFDLP